MRDICDGWAIESGRYAGTCPMNQRVLSATGDKEWAIATPNVLCRQPGEDKTRWLRNLDRKPWSLEIPYETGGDVRPMFPDLVVVRKSGSEFAIDILEPHDPSLSDNFEKAVGLAKFAEKHGGLFGRIQLIRKQSSAGGEHFARLEINQATTIKKLLLITSNPQLDDLFTSAAT